MSDLDDLQFKSENVHCLGGQFGTVLIALDSVIKLVAQQNLLASDFMKKFIEEFLLNQLTDTQLFELKYLESNLFDFTNITDEKRKDFNNFLVDNRRFVNKSIKLLLEKGFLGYDIFENLLGIVAETYFQQPKDPAQVVEIDPENQEPEYLELIKKKQDEVTQENLKIEKMKKKIKLNFIKTEDLKKKRNNIGGFIIVHPNPDVVDSLVEIEEPPKEDKPAIDNVPDNVINNTDNNTDPIGNDGVDVNNPDLNNINPISDNDNNNNNDNVVDNLPVEEKKSNINQIKIFYL